MKECFLSLCLIFSVSVFAEKPVPLLEATANMDVMVLSLPVIEVQKALPSYLELVPQGLTKHGTHLVFLFYATHKDLRFIGSPAGSGMNYNEAITVIPFVRVKGNASVFNYMAQLHLDELMPIYLGLRIYGFMKDLAKIERLDQLFYATDPLSGELLFDQITVPMRKWNEENFKKNWGVFSKIASHPIVSNLNGTVMCTMGQYEFQNVVPIQAYVELGAKGVPGLGTEQKEQTLVVPGLDEYEFEGGVQYKVHYTLSAPTPVDQCVH